MTGPGKDLFNFMSDKLREFLIDHDILHKKHFLGFTFSFPTVQHSLKSADLVTWTKVGKPRSLQHFSMIIFIFTGLHM